MSLRRLIAMYLHHSFPSSRIDISHFGKYHAPMRLIKRKTFIDFGERHANAKASVLHLARLIETAAWASPLEVAQSVAKSKVVTNDRLRFEISGGSFRAIVAFDWVKQIAFVKFVGTHAEYDRIDTAMISEF